MNPLRYITPVVCWWKCLRVDGAAHIPAHGPALIAAAHDSPLDLFYVLTMMRLAHRPDFRIIMAAELFDPECFRPYARNAIATTVPWAARLAGAAARLGSWIVPPLLSGLHPIPVYRQGDDSASREEALACLLNGQVVGIAPGQGDDRHRGADGQRPLAHGVAAMARRFFEVTGQPLPVIPVGLRKRRDGWRQPTDMRIGEALRTMSDQGYPALFSPAGQNDIAVKQQAYQHFPRQLAERLSELSS